MSRSRYVLQVGPAQVCDDISHVSVHSLMPCSRGVFQALSLYTLSCPVPRGVFQVGDDSGVLFSSCLSTLFRWRISGHVPVLYTLSCPVPRGVFNVGQAQVGDDISHVSVHSLMSRSRAVFHAKSLYCLSSHALSPCRVPGRTGPGR